MSGKLGFVPEIHGVCGSVITGRNALDLLKPLSEKAFKIVSMRSEMSAGVPIASNGPADTSDNQSPNGAVEEQVRCTEVNLGHLILFVVVQTLISFCVGFGSYWWGRRARLKKPYRSRPNTLRLVLPPIRYGF